MSWSIRPRGSSTTQNRCSCVGVTVLGRVCRRFSGRSDADRVRDAFVVSDDGRTMLVLIIVRGNAADHYLRTLPLWAR